MTVSAADLGVKHAIPRGGHRRARPRGRTPAGERTRTGGGPGAPAFGDPSGPHSGRARYGARQAPVTRSNQGVGVQPASQTLMGGRVVPLPSHTPVELLQSVST